MATAQYTKQSVTVAAEKQIEKVRNRLSYKRLANDGRLRQRAAEIAKPKWYRPWRLSECDALWHAMYGEFGHKVPDSCEEELADQIKSLESILHLARTCQSEWITLGPGEVRLLQF